MAVNPDDAPPPTDPDNLSWLEVGDFSTPPQAALRLRISAETVRVWAQAGFIRYLANGRPKRFLLCGDDIEHLAALLRDVARPTLTLLRALNSDWPTCPDRQVGRF